MAKLLYQGHGSLRITSDAGSVMYFDPFAGEGYDKPADIIIVSHEHSDHNQVDLCAKKPGCRILRSAEMLLDGKYRCFDVAGYSIQAVPAYNSHHDKNKCVGCIIEIDGVVIYAAGDTSLTDYMQDKAGSMHIDYCFLPIDGIYNMDIPEAEECAEYIMAKHVTPIHMAPGELFDEARAEKFQVPGRLILKPGEEIELKKS